MRDYRSSRPALMGPALGAFIAVLAVAGVLAYIVLNGGQNPDPVQPTPVGTAIAAPSGQDELALNPTQTPTPGATNTPEATTVPAAPVVTPTPRAIKAPTSRPMPAPTATALPNVRVTPSPTASPTPRATATPRARATPKPVVLPSVSGGVAERRQPTVAPVEAAVIAVEPEPTVAFVLPIQQQPVVVPQQPVFDNSQSNSGADALATVLAAQGRPADNVPGFVPDPSSGQPAFDFPDIVIPTPNFPQSSIPRDSGARQDLASAIRAANPAVRDIQRNQSPAAAANSRTRATPSLGDDIRKRVLDAQKKQTPTKKQDAKADDKKDDKKDGDKDKRAKPSKPNSVPGHGDENRPVFVLPGDKDD